MTKSNFKHAMWALMVLATAAAGANPPLVAVAPETATPPDYGHQDDGSQPVFTPKECVGPIVGGVCHGAVIPKGPQKRCYGEMLNGKCTGPVM